MLSKSKFIRGINCHKSLWLYVHKKKERHIDDLTQFVFKQGTNAGEIARQYFPGGKLAVYEDYPNFESANRTKKLIDSGIETIYEATFVYNKTIVAVDILTKIDGAWHLFEFKSTTSIKDQHIKDIAIQYYVIAGSGVPIKEASIMYMNRDYVRIGNLDLKNLFIHQPVLKDVIELQPFVEENSKILLQVEKQTTEPKVNMGIQCSTPYKCDFYDYCSLLTPLANLEETKEQSNETKINKEELKIFLKESPYPLYFLDFETIMPCIPLFDLSRPYQQIPFQYSLHYKAFKTSELIHFGYLAETEGDPRPELIKKLINDTKKPGYILVYNIGFERSRIIEMQRDFPEYASYLETIIVRLIDLMAVFRKQHFVTESMEGRYSIKNVLPALCPDLSYSNLKINNGGDASSAFLALYEEKDKEKVDKERNDLLKYSEMDTFAMVKIFEVLEKTIS